MNKQFKNLGRNAEVEYTNPEWTELEVFENPNRLEDYTITFIIPEFTSLCPITGQPDFATIHIEYVPNNWCVESKSLKLYILRYRQSGSFMEEIVNKIKDDLMKALDPRRITVKATFNPRGGIEAMIEV